MAFSKVPSGLFGASYAADSTTLTLTLSELAALSSGDADASTGDSRQILLNILTQVLDSYNAMAEADRPTKCTITRNVINSNLGGDFRSIFTITFDVANSATPALVAE